MGIISKKVTDAIGKALIANQIGTSKFIVNQVGSTFRVEYISVSIDNLADATKLADDLNKVIAPTLTATVAKLESEIEGILNA